jgi:hypothetical protein
MASLIFHREKKYGVNIMEGWVSPRGGLDTAVKRDISHPAEN